MRFNRMLIEKESPEEFGYDRIKCNLTESSTSDKTLKDLGIKIPDDLLLCYGDHLGKPELRELIGKNYAVAPNEVMITVGACMALFIVYSTLLEPGDHVVVMQPNYPANIEIPRSLGCDVEMFPLRFEDGFRLDTDALIRKIRPETKLVNITYPHNPTGTMITPGELRKLTEACEARRCHIMVDETYGDLTIGERIPHVAALSGYGICVESLSKAIGVPGIRAGWIVTSDKALLERMVAVKEQVCICTSIVDEECAYQVFARKDSLMAPIRADISEKFSILCGQMQSQSYLEWVKPQGGVVCFPRVRSGIDLDTAEFYRVLNEKYGTFVGPGHWFDMDDRYFRIGYAWPGKEELKEGLANILRAIEDVRRA